MLLLFAIRWGPVYKSGPAPIWSTLDRWWFRISTWISSSSSVPSVLCRIPCSDISVAICCCQYRPSTRLCYQQSSQTACRHRTASMLIYSLFSSSWVVGCWCGYLSGARCRLAYDWIFDFCTIYIYKCKKLNSLQHLVRTTVAGSHN